MLKSQALCLFLVVLMGCSLFSNSDDPVDQLPPITQEGKNTFGFKLNGKVWLPKGNAGTNNLSLSYDPSYDSGTFDLRAYRFYNSSDHEYIILYVNKLRSVGVVFFSDTARSEVVFYGIRDECNYHSRDSGILESGHIEITRLDLSEGIVAGRFEFTLRKTNCDTIRVTDGTFDIRL